MPSWSVRHEQQISDGPRARVDTCARLRTNRDTGQRPVASSPQRVCGSARRLSCQPSPFDAGRTNDKPQARVGTSVEKPRAVQWQRRIFGQARPTKISHTSESSARHSAPPLTAPRPRWSCATCATKLSRISSCRSPVRLHTNDAYLDSRSIRV